MAALGLAGALAGIGSVIGNAIKNNSNKNQSSSSSTTTTSGSSGGSSGGSSSNSYGNHTSGGGSSNLTLSDMDKLKNEAASNSAAWGSASDADKQALHDRNTQIYEQLGYDYDDSTGKWTPGTGAPAVSQNAGYNTAIGQYEDMRQAQEAANQAAVDANVAQLNGQKDSVRKAGVEGNKAAQEAYMTVINPNGSLAESLAARGLLSSGLTESSQISAGNAYQGALNNNQTTVTEQLAEIERAITQAQLSGDLASAEALASYYEKVANAALSNASAISGLQQWGVENKQNQTQQNFENDVTMQQIAMQKKELERQLSAGQITQDQYNQMFQQQLRELQLSNKYSEAQLRQMGYM